MVNTRRTPTSRKSHHKEFIHKAVEHYQEMSLGNAKNRIGETAKYLGINGSNVRRWIKTEIKL